MLKRFLSGRIDRKGFVLGFLYYIGILLAVLLLYTFIWSFLLVHLNPHASRAKVVDPIVVMVIVCYIAAILWELSLYVRRLHDVNRPGWMAILGLIPFANIVFFVYLLIAEGDVEKNDYGKPMHKHNFYDVTLLGRE